MRRVYSYIRFSTPDQAEGHSLQRQADYARQYAEKHGLALDETLSMRDEGLSAYHQAHVRRGALGVFLRAVEEGLVPAGSLLIVEGLDRLSRAEPLQAQAQLAQIITAGVSVITASDGKEYSRESLKKTPMDLLYALLVMIRAHEESDTKSRRVRASIHARIERWLDWHRDEADGCQGAFARRLGLDRCALIRFRNRTGSSTSLPPTKGARTAVRSF